MKTYRENPDGPENTEATKQNEREKFALKMEDKQGQTLWHVEHPFQEEGTFVAETKTTAIVCKVWGENRDEADRRANIIVRAVNNHAKLMEALTQIAADDRTSSGIVAIARAALAAATEGAQ